MSGVYSSFEYSWQICPVSVRCLNFVRIFVKKTVWCLSVCILSVSRLDKDETGLSWLTVCLSAEVWCAVTLFNFRDNCPSSFKLSNLGQNFPNATKLSNFSEIFKLRKKVSNFAQFFPTSVSYLQLCFALSNLNRNFPTLDFPTKNFPIFRFFQLPFQTTYNLYYMI